MPLLFIGLVGKFKNVYDFFSTHFPRKKLSNLEKYLYIPSKNQFNRNYSLFDDKDRKTSLKHKKILAGQKKTLKSWAEVISEFNEATAKPDVFPPLFRNFVANSHTWDHNCQDSCELL